MTTIDGTRETIAEVPETTGANTPKKVNSTHESNKNGNAASQLADPSISTWFDAIIPAQVIPYTRLARLDKPIGTMLLVSSLS
jgi:hypothetical protein